MLGNFIKAAEYDYVMRMMNETLHRYWPCVYTIWLGYLLAPFTLGLSLLLPNLCIADAKKGLITAVTRQNRIKLSDRGLKLSYRQGCMTSWLEMEIIDKEKGVKMTAETEKDEDDEV